MEMTLRRGLTVTLYMYMYIHVPVNLTAMKVSSPHGVLLLQCFFGNLDTPKVEPNREKHIMISNQMKELNVL